MTTQNTQQQTGGEFAALANSAPFEREPTVGIQVMRRRWGPFRPVLWLMCPWKLETWTRGTSQHFQVGEFRDWRSANLAKGRLEDVLRKQWGKAQKIDLMDAASHAPDSLETPSGVPCSAWLGRVRALQADAAELKKFVEALTEAERTGPLRTVNQAIAQAWAVSLQMQAVVIRSERPNAELSQPPSNA